MRSRLTRLILLALLVALGAWVFRLHRAPQAPPASASLGPGPGFGETRRVVISTRADSVVIVREHDGYWVVRPLRDRADASYLAELRRQVEQLRASRVLPDTTGAPFGLAPPRVRLTLEAESGACWSLALGDSSPVGSQIYARVLRRESAAAAEGRARRDGSGREALPENPVVLIEAFTARKYFMPGLKAVRNRIAATLRDGPLDSLAVLIVSGEVRAARRTEGGWVCRMPPGLTLDPARVNPVVQAFRSPAIVDFTDPRMTLRDAGLDPPRATWILFQGSRAETVRVGNPTGDGRRVRILPAGRSYPAVLESDFFRNMVDGWTGLADLHLVSIPAESVRVVEFVGDPRAGSYRRGEADSGRAPAASPGRWIRLPSGRAVPRPRDLQDDVRNLTLLQWRAYPEREAPSEPNQPRLILALRSATQAETVALAARDTTGLARSTRHRRWGEVTETAWRVWRYRSEHPE